jgi:hypothetical protein
MAQTAAESYIEEGYAQVAKEWRAAIRTILERRFGRLPEAIERDLAATIHPDKLQQATLLAVFAPSLDEFRL